MVAAVRLVELALEVAGAVGCGHRQHRGVAEPVAPEVRPQQRQVARLGLDGDHAAGLGDGLGSDDAEVADVRAHVEERHAGPKLGAQEALLGGLPRPGLLDLRGDHLVVAMHEQRAVVGGYVDDVLAVQRRWDRTIRAVEREQLDREREVVRGAQLAARDRPSDPLHDAARRLAGSAEARRFVPAGIDALLGRAWRVEGRSRGPGSWRSWIRGTS
jgi:hypothetical protein